VAVGDVNPRGNSTGMGLGSLAGNWQNSSVTTILIYRQIKLQKHVVVGETLDSQLGSILGSLVHQDVHFE
jgi:hypothetical protein